ncbi:MAG: hypothetical protein US86_C0002G0009 [Candidatus Daviesbacteria bacterium GW2011_GWA2_38_24]|uniref:Integral membrane protein n=1 Tax=Candidatus Daviesbacteria bacterium GW2011_GWA2_38_24 TaxID=1618422 RepID=A0A0G0JJ76_9BACT|nr:MAG: hypothetical protein US86_C0002G0009 [Candidatus Daviesbacteria bacterium GW2011_GWA2_38_24]KKQ79061.1 MAG: hypothetical protein UT01_C0052G0008 [Candidatus Daviesbacteria bacterium GW2011_GWA1_38_7]OGE24294.1 MAG: hypothetical protein A2688_03185 [Candidatus Daviesbacteria bacterium RIFCSPHIGHO2_01_FULL_38_8]
MKKLIFFLLTFTFVLSLLLSTPKTTNASHPPVGTRDPNIVVGTYCDQGVQVEDRADGSHVFTNKPCTVEDVFGKITPPAPIARIGFGAQGISTFISNIINLLLSVSLLVLAFMIFWAGFQWMTAGGDKEQIAKARARITNALIGLLILSLAFFVARQIGIITGFRFPGTGN